MKNLLILFLVIFVFYGCSDSNESDEDSNSNDAFDVGNLTAYLDFDSESHEINVKSNTNWKIKSISYSNNLGYNQYPWCTLNKESGNGDDVIKVDVDKNTSYDSRDAKIAFEYGGRTSVLTIKQKGDKINNEFAYIKEIKTSIKKYDYPNGYYMFEDHLSPFSSGYNLNYVSHKKSTFDDNRYSKFHIYINTGMQGRQWMSIWVENNQYLGYEGILQKLKTPHYIKLSYNKPSDDFPQISNINGSNFKCEVKDKSLIFEFNSLEYIDTHYSYKLNGTMKFELTGRDLDS